MRPCRLTLSLRLVAIGFALAIASEFAPASAADTVHAGKAAAPVWTFTLLDIGIEQGIFAKYGLDVDITSFAGDAKIQQAMASGSIDFGLGSGPSMAFAVKGIPVIAVAAFAREPRNLGIIVAADSPAKTAADLKGKLVGVPSVFVRVEIGDPSRHPHIFHRRQAAAIDCGRREARIVFVFAHACADRRDQALPGIDLRDKPDHVLFDHAAGRGLAPIHDVGMADVGAASCTKLDEIAPGCPRRRRNDHR